MNKYKEASELIHNVFREYTDLVEPLSLDEAFLDVTNSENCGGSERLMAKEIKEKIFKRTQLTASAGVAPNKFLAKVGSDWNKPDGLTVINSQIVPDFVEELPVSKISGVGKVTQEKMARLGIYTCYDLQEFGLSQLRLYFGKYANFLHNVAHGIDKREVQTSWVRKSLSLENTFREDLAGLEDCKVKIPGLVGEFRARLERFKERGRPFAGISKFFVKVKFNDFKSVTVEKSRGKEFYETLWDGEWTAQYEEEIYKLLTEGYERFNKPVRLLGMGVKFMDLPNSNDEKQQSLLLEAS